MKTKAISFDLWSTLIKSHSDFKTQRALYFFNKFNPAEWHLDRIEIIIRSVEKHSDLLSESTGVCVQPKHIIANILINLSIEVENLTIDDFNKIENDINILALTYPPQSYDKNTIPMLRWLGQLGYKICTASNTGFLSNVIMREILKNIGISEHVDVQVYSDVVGFSKPSSKFFEEVSNQLGTTDYLHVGDNPKADGLAPHAFIINSNDNSILDLKKKLEQEYETTDEINICS